MCFQATFCPTGSTLSRFFSVFKSCRIRDTFVKSHDDICTQSFLHVSSDFRIEVFFATVNVGAEHYAIFGNFAHCTQAEYLEAATIGKHTTVVVHELMQTASFLYQFVTGTQEQVVSICQNNLATHIVQFFRRQGFYCCLSTYGHKHRSIEGTMGSVQLT